MGDTNQTEGELLKSVLAPLLEDFQYWFARSRDLLEREEMPFLGHRQADLLARVKQAQQEVTTAQMLFQATEGTVGVETSTMLPWHELVTECWKVSQEFRTRQASSGPDAV